MADLGGLAGVFGGSAVGSAVVRLVLDSSQYERQLAGARGQTQAGLSQMGGGISKFKMLAAGAFAAAGYAAIRFAADSVRSYLEHEKALIELQRAIANSPQLIGASTDAFEAQATALQNLTGRQDEEIIAAQTVLTRFKLTEQQIHELIPLILDYAQVTGTDAATAASNIGKALLGNTRALKTVGVEFTATGDRADDTATIIDALRQKVGGAAEDFGKTLPGQMAIAAAKFDDVKERVGEALIPALADLAETGAKIAEDLGPALVVVFGLVGDAAAQLADEVNEILGPFATLLDLLPDVSAAGDDTESTFWRLFHAGQELVKPSNFLVPFKGLYSAFERFKNGADDSADATEGVTRATGSYFGAASAASRETLNLASAHEKAAANIREHRLAELSLVDSFVGIQASAQEVADAQKALNELERKGKTDTKAYQQAVADAILAQSGLKASVMQYAQELEDGGATQAEIERRIRKFAESLGIAKGDVNELIDAINAYNRTDLEDKQATVDVMFHYNDPGNVPRAGNHAAGAVIGAAAGIVRRPTFLVGEGTYGTTFGRGAEAVLPLNDSTMDRLGAAIARHIRGGDGTTVVPVVWSDEFEGRVLTTVRRDEMRRQAL